MVKVYGVFISGRVASDRTRSVERGLHGGCKQVRQLSDVIESFDPEDGLLDGGPALGRDDAVGQLGVLITDVRIRKAPVAGAARVYDLGGASSPVVEGQAHLGCELLVDREVIVGRFLVNWSMSTSPSRRATATT